MIAGGNTLVFEADTLHLTILPEPPQTKRQRAANTVQNCPPR